MNTLIAVAVAPLALLAAVVLGAAPIRTLVKLQYILTLIVVGLLTYYGGIRSATWIPYAFSMFVLGMLLLRNQLRTGVNVWPPFVVLLLLYFLELFATTLGSGAPGGQIFVGLKIYAPLWLFAVALLAAINADPDRFMNWMERAALFLAALQFPFVLMQFFYSSRLGGRFNADAIVGTFGGDPLHSGQNPTLLMFSIIGILVAIEMRQTSRLSARAFAILVPVFATNIVLGEVKAVFLLLPLALMVQQLRAIRLNPLKAALGVGLTILFLLLVGEAYQAFFWSDRAGHAMSLAARAQESFGYFFDPRGINFQTGEVSRGASLSLWWNDRLDSVHRLLGFGIGSTRVDSTIANGVVGRRFAPLDIASTALAQLLWDGGVLGAALFVAALVAAYRQARRLARAAADRVDAARLHTIAAVLALAVPFLVYNRYMVDAPAEQLLLVTIFALLWQRSHAARHILQEPPAELERAFAR